MAEELLPHSINDLKRIQREIRNFIKANIAANPDYPDKALALSWSFSCMEALELVEEALAFANIRDGESDA